MDDRDPSSAKTSGSKEDDGDSLARQQQKVKLRMENLRWASAKREDESRALDSSMKRCTSLIKRLKSTTFATAEDLTWIKNEVAALRLEKYLSEIAAALLEAKIKISQDLFGFIEVCSMFHQRFGEFSELMLASLLKLLASPPAVRQEKEDDRVARLNRQRIALRLLTELILYGIVTDETTLIKSLKDLMTSDTDLINISIAVTFVKFYAKEFFGVTSAKNKETLTAKSWTNDLPEPFLSSMKQESFHAFFSRYYDRVQERLLSEHKTMRSLEKSNQNYLNTKGELTEEMKTNYEKAVKSFEKLLSNTQILSDGLNADLPQFPEEEKVTRVSAGFIVGSSNSFKEEKAAQDFSNSIFEDESQKSFYEDLVELRALVPEILLGDTASKKSKEDKAKPAAAPEGSSERGPESASSASSAEVPSNQNQDLSTAAPDESASSSATPGSSAVGGSAAFQTLMERLPNLINRDSIDSAVVEYFILNTKGNRKRLASTLLVIPRGRLELIPYYARFIANVNPYLPDVAAQVLASLDEEFTGFIKKKDQMNLEYKIRNIRYIGELTKFKICPSNTTFNYMRMLLEDFTHHNIDIMCALVESCGRFLHRSPETQIRMVNMLEMMMKKKSVQHLDNRHTLMVENAFYMCNPPEKATIYKKARKPEEEYIRYLLYSVLAKSTVDYTLKQLRKFHWDQKETYMMILKYFTKVWKVKFSSIRHLANIASALARFHEEFGISLVDAILEEIRFALEENDFRKNQRRLATVCFLGELYNYQMLDAKVMFETMYGILSFGHVLGFPSPEHPNSLDMPDDFFRVRLVCMLLETSGIFLEGESSSAKKQMDVFLVVFQHYMLSKGMLPMEAEFLVTDTFEILRPHMQLFRTVEESAAALEKCRAEEQERMQRNMSSKSTATGSAPSKTSNASSNNSASAKSNASSIAQAHQGKAANDENDDDRKENEEEADDVDDENDENDDDEEDDDLVADDSGDDEDDNDDDDDSGTNQEGSGDDIGEDDEDGDEDDDDADDDDDDENDDDDLDDDNDVGDGNDGPSRSASGKSKKSRKKKKKEVGQEGEGSQGAGLPSAGRIKTVEEDEFEKELSKLMNESLDARKNERKAAHLDIPIPMQLIGSEKEKEKSDGAGVTADKKAVVFTLLSKRGNKNQTRALEIPSDSSLVLSTLSQQDAEREEQQRMKRIVLGYEQREQQAVYNEEMTKQKMLFANNSGTARSPGFAYRQAYMGASGKQGNRSLSQQQQQQQQPSPVIMGGSRRDGYQGRQADAR